MRRERRRRFRVCVSFYALKISSFIHPSLSLSVSPRNGRLLPFLGSTSLYFFALQFFNIFIVFHLHILYDFMFFCVLNLNSCISLFTGEIFKLKCKVSKFKFHQKFHYHHNQILNGIWVCVLALELMALLGLPTLKGETLQCASM